MSAVEYTVEEVERGVGASWLVEAGAVEEAVARHYGVRREALAGRSRHAALAIVRHVAAYLLQRRAGLSSPAIGRRLGRHHTTVLASVRRVVELLASDIGLQRRVGEIERALDRRI